MPLQLIQLNPFRDQYRDALAFLHRLGVKTGNNRLATYLRVLNNAIDAEAQSNETHQDDAAFANTIVEAADIIAIASLDPASLVDHDVLTKLRRIHRGPPIMREDGDDEARNLAFEFSTAAAFRRRGGFAGFTTAGGDLLVTAPELVPVECKRISSLPNLFNRIRDAREQLERGVTAGNAPGVIALDLTRPIGLAQGPIVANADAAFTDAADQRLTAYIHEHLLEQHAQLLQVAGRPAVLGLALRYYAAGTAGDRANVRSATVWQLYPLHEDDHDANELFKRVAGFFGEGPLRPIEPDAVDEARRNVAL